MLLAADGASLSLADMNLEALQKVKQDCVEAGASKVLISKVNIVDTEEVEKWIVGTVHQLGPLDGACNAAGIAPEVGGPIEKLADKGSATLLSMLRPQLTRMYGRLEFGYRTPSTPG